MHFHGDQPSLDWPGTSHLSALSTAPLDASSSLDPLYQNPSMSVNYRKKISSGYESSAVGRLNSLLNSDSENRNALSSVTGSEANNLTSGLSNLEMGPNLAVGTSIPNFEDLPFRQLVTTKGAYFCPLCQGEFFNKTNFRHHYMRHSGEKPYKCSYCSHRSRQMGSLNKHIKLRHMKEGL